MKNINDRPIIADVFTKYGSPKPNTEYPIHGFLIHYAFFELENDEAIDYVQVNHDALKIVAYNESELFDDTGGGSVQNNRFVITYDPSKMTSQPITVEQFVGPRYDIARKKLILQDNKDHHYYYASSSEKSPKGGIDMVQRERDIQDGRDLYEGHIARGYADAFTDPVHGLQLSNEEKEAFFRNINNVLFNDFEDDLDILQWSTDWSSYFDAGHEWWGAYWWTVHNKTKNWVIVVAASGTD